MAILTGEHLQVALSRTDRAIELRDTAGVSIVSSLNPAEVVVYLARGYEAHGTKRRVRYLAPASPRPKAIIDRREFIRDDGFWDGRGCIRFWKDQQSPHSNRISA